MEAAAGLEWSHPNWGKCLEAYRAAVLVAEEHVEDRQLVHVVMQGEGGALLRRSKVQQGLTWRLHKAERRAERERRANEAAALIQITWRGYATRREFARNVHKFRVMRKIQSAYRSYRSRKGTKVKRFQLTVAVIQIQSRVRAFLDKCRTNRKRAAVVMVQR